MVELRKTQNNIAIVLDEYGATAGSLPWRICWRRSWARSAMSTMRTRRSDPPDRTQGIRGGGGHEAG